MTAIKLTARAHTVAVHCKELTQCKVKATNLELSERSLQLLFQAPHPPLQVCPLLLQLRLAAAASLPLAANQLHVTKPCKEMR